MSLVDSALKSAQKLTDSMGNGRVAAVHYYGYPQKLQDTQFFVDDLGPLKTKLREYKRKL